MNIDIASIPEKCAVCNASKKKRLILVDDRLRGLGVYKLCRQCLREKKAPAPKDEPSCCPTSGTKTCTCGFTCASCEMGGIKHAMKVTLDGKDRLFCLKCLVAIVKLSHERKKDAEETFRAYFVDKAVV